MLTLGLFSCLSQDQNNQPAKAANDGAPPAAQTSPAASEASSVESAKNISRQSKDREKPTTPFEPSAADLEKSIPASVRARMRCSIEEKVTVSPPDGGPSQLQVRFDARGSRAPCGRIVSWVWDFGDGTTGKGRRVKHTYTKPGEYQAHLRLTDDRGNSNLASLDYVVSVRAEKSPDDSTRPIRRRRSAKPRS